MYAQKHRHICTRTGLGGACGDLPVARISRNAEGHRMHCAALHSTALDCVRIRMPMLLTGADSFGTGLDCALLHDSRLR